MAAGRGIAGSAVVLAVAALAAACTAVVTGRVRPAPGLTPGPLTGTSVKQALLDDAELAGMFGQSFGSDPTIAPRFGGPEALPDGWSSAVPADCVGAAVGSQQIAYQSLNVHDIAQEFWVGTGAVTAVAEGVVALPTAADAETAFGAFAAQWTRCEGITVRRYQDDADTDTGEVTAVRTGDAVLTATVHTNLGDAGIRVERALGVRLNCLVDVDVFVAADAAAADTGAADVARAIMTKVSALAP